MACKNLTSISALISALVTVALSIGVALPAGAQLASALLPSSRSAEVGDTVTVFSTVINAGTETATDCQIDQLGALPLTVGFQTTDPATNATTGTANTPVDLLPGQAQSFVLSITPTAIIDSNEVEFAFTCASGESATTIEGVNTLLLSASDTPVVDVIALSATAQNTGVLSLDNSVGAFALATINLGAADSNVSVTADTGNQALPVQLSVCETNDSGECLQGGPAPSIVSNIASGGTPTFSVFSNASGAIANDPAVNRVFVRFTDSNGVVRGGTSVALENQVSASVPNLANNSLAVLNQGLGLLEIDGEPDDNGVFSLDATLACEQTGVFVVVGSLSVDPTGATDSGTLDANLSFQDCDGVTGTVNIVVVSTFTDTEVSFNATQTGSYSSLECSAISLDNVQTSSVINLDGNDGTNPPLTTSGSISGVCGNQSFTCSLDDVDLQDQDALDNSCLFE